jgi:hypothetical protein
VRRALNPATAGARKDAKQHMPAEGGLMIGGIHDAAEKTADRVADRVMRMPAPSPVVHRKCDECEAKDKKARRQPAEQEEETAKMKPGGTPIAAGATSVAAPKGIAKSVGAMGTGKPLARSERTFFEPRFGADLSGVRVHDGPVADKAARSMGARAFTLGQDIAFASGEHRTGTTGGRHLLAHELAHATANDGSARRHLRRAFGKCTSKSDEDTIVTSHTLSKAEIKEPGDKAGITIQFGCKPRSFTSEIVDSKGTAIVSKQKTIWNGKFKPDAAGVWKLPWDGKRGFAKVGTFMADDGTYKHRITNVAYAAGAKSDKVAKSGGVLSTSPDITVATRAGVTGKRNLTPAEQTALVARVPAWMQSAAKIAAATMLVDRSQHFLNAKGNIKNSNVDDMATAIRSEAEGFSDAEKKAIAWSIRNEMVRINSFSVADAKAAFNFADNKAGGTADKKFASDVLVQDMSMDPTSGTIKWYSPRSMPPHNKKAKCKSDGGTFDCSGGTVTLTDGTKKSSKAPGFAKHMTFVDVPGVTQFNFRFYKL